MFVWRVSFTRNAAASQYGAGGPLECQQFFYQRSHICALTLFSLKCLLWPTQNREISINCLQWYLCVCHSYQNLTNVLSSGMSTAMRSARTIICILCKCGNGTSSFSVSIQPTRHDKIIIRKWKHLIKFIFFFPFSLIPFHSINTQHNFTIIIFFFFVLSSRLNGAVWAPVYLVMRKKVFPCDNKIMKLIKKMYLCSDWNVGFLLVNFVDNLCLKSVTELVIHE